MGKARDFIPALKYGNKIYPEDNVNPPAFGNYYYVDATNGTDGENSGTTVDKPFKTIQAAITAQIADASALGDVIYVLPGTYAETLTGALTKVQLIGVGANQVIVAPTDSNAYTGAINDSTISGIQFRTPSTSNVTYAALAATDLIGSRITDCIFSGTTDPTSVAVGTVGIRIGAETDGTWEMMLNSRIDNNRFIENAGRTTALSIGICFGNVDDTDNNATRVFRHSIIDHNLIAAEFYGIKLNTANANNNGAVIDSNWIHSQQGGAGGVGVGIGQTVETDALTLVTNNRISAASDAIENFSTANVQGNIVSNGADAAVAELPVST